MSVGAINATGTLDISSSYPRINLNDTTNEDDWSIINDDGTFGIYNVDDNVYGLRINGSNDSTFAGDLTVSGGEVILGGISGRVSGVVTVLSSTDATSKSYVDNAIAAAPQGDITAVVAGTGMSGGGTSGSVTLNCSITNNNQLSNGAGYTTNAGTVTSVLAGNLGIDVTGGSIPRVFLDFNELPVIDGVDPTLDWFIVEDGEDENSKISLANARTSLTADKSQFVLNSNFSDDSSTTSYVFAPFNSLSDTTSAQYYVHWAAPCGGVVKRVIMQHVYGSMSSGLTTQIRITKNGSTTTTSGELTASNGTNDGSFIEFNPGGSSTGNVTFVKGDRFTFSYQKNTTGRYWRGVAFSVIIQLDKI